MIDGCYKPSMDVPARLTRALVRRRLAWIGDWLAEGAGDAETRSAMADILAAHERGNDGAVASLEEWLIYGPRDRWRRDHAVAPRDDEDGDVVVGAGTVVYVFGDGEAALLVHLQNRRQDVLPPPRGPGLTRPDADHGDRDGSGARAVRPRRTRAVPAPAAGAGRAA